MPSPYLILIILLLALSNLATWLLLGSPPIPSPTGPTLTIESILPLSELTTTLVQVSDVREVKVKGYLGEIHVLLIAQGEAEFGFDLTRAQFTDVDEVHRTATLVLPEPQVRRPRLDHTPTRIVAVWQSGWWAIVPGQAEANREMVNRSLQISQEAITGAISPYQSPSGISTRENRSYWVFDGAILSPAYPRWIFYP